MKIAIIGGGMAGLGAAYELAAGRQHEITVFEKSPTLGGLAASVRVGGTPLEAFYHHLFPTYYDFLEIADTIGIRDAIFFRKAETAIFYGGRLYRFTSPTDLLRFAPLGMADRLRTGAMLGRLKLSKRWHQYEDIAAADWLRRHFGERAYAVLWRPLLESKFGAFAGRVSMAWFWGRIYERPSRFGYFDGGFKTITDALGRHLEKQGASIRTGTAVEAIQKTGGGFEVKTAEKSERFDQVIVAAPPIPFLNLSSPLLPPDFTERVRALKYLGTLSLILVLDRQLSPSYWLNINDRTQPFLAVVEQTNFVEPAAYGGKHVVYVGKYLDAEDAFYAKPDAELWQLCMAFLKNINPAFEERWVLERHLFRAPFTQPVIPVSYQKIRPGYRTPVAGLWWVSMSHIYPWDRGTDHSFHAGRELAAELLGG